MNPDSGLSLDATAQQSSVGRHPASRRPVLRWATSGRALALLAAVLFLANVILCFPGVMDNDSRNQYAEAISGHYIDWHPPVMAWLWSLLRLIALVLAAGLAARLLDFQAWMK